LQAEHRADDVDDRIERADLVEMDLLHGRVVDRRLGLRQPLEEGLRPIAPGRGQRRRIDEPVDLGQAPMGMAMTRGSGLGAGAWGLGVGVWDAGWGGWGGRGYGGAGRAASREPRAASSSTLNFVAETPARSTFSA